jgi:triphosphoribosyl-dephospho-CoA synthase
VTGLAQRQPEVAFPRSAADAVSALAATCLLAELHTWPKPGLVSLVDSGSHLDMDAGTFRRSIAAIAPFFGALAQSGAKGAAMDDLRRIGRAAEYAMLAATGGINTHRGAIFGLGLLCAAAGVAWEHTAMPHSLDAPVERQSLSAAALCAIVRQRWGMAIVAGPIPPNSHGARALHRFGAGGARAQAAAGFPHVLQLGLPALRQAREAAPGQPGAAQVQVFFALLSEVEDTNLLHRGGQIGLNHARRQARLFLVQGGVGHPRWRAHACAIHRDFVSRGLSPGGCADLLTATLFLDSLETPQ